jgi:hypothetical protein
MLFIVISSPSSNTGYPYETQELASYNNISSAAKPNEVGVIANGVAEPLFSSSLLIFSTSKVLSTNGINLPWSNNLCNSL